MINPKDLRIGNILKMPIIGIVTILELRERVARISYTNTESNSPYNQFEGTPLTEKILLDSGFVECEDDDYEGRAFKLWQDRKMLFCVISAFHEFDFHSRKGYIPCHETAYVHNLQNAYRLATGQDLDLVINNYSTTIP